MYIQGIHICKRIWHAYNFTIIFRDKQKYLLHYFLLKIIDGITFLIELCIFGFNVYLFIYLMHII